LKEYAKFRYNNLAGGVRNMGKKHYYHQKRKKRKTSSNALVRPQKRNWRATIKSLIVSFLIVATVCLLFLHFWPSFEFYSKENAIEHVGVVTKVYTEYIRISRFDSNTAWVFIELDSNKVYCRHSKSFISNGYEVGALRDELLGKQVKIECRPKSPTRIATLAIEDKEIIPPDYTNSIVIENIIAVIAVFVLIYAGCVTWILLTPSKNEES
jgi:hypothetical protein